MTSFKQVAAAALAMPRSAIQTRPTMPCRASMVFTIVCKVFEIVSVAGEHFVAKWKAVEPAVEPVLVDGFVAKPQQIAQRRAAIPVLGDVQLARQLAEPRCHQNGRHLRPRDPLLARRKQAFASRTGPGGAPRSSACHRHASETPQISFTGGITERAADAPKRDPPVPPLVRIEPRVERVQVSRSVVTDHRWAVVVILLVHALLPAA